MLDDKTKRLTRDYQPLTSLILIWLLLVSGTISANDDHKDGLAVYKKANCVGCHKWHGGGGGGYGGSAKSLRETTLDEAGLTLLIRCGRPATGMPFHVRAAYKGDNTDCYDTTKAALGDKAPPRARTFLRDPEIEAVVAYVLNAIKAKGEPTKEECFAFWGDNAKECM